MNVLSLLKQRTRQALEQLLRDRQEFHKLLDGIAERDTEKLIRYADLVRPAQDARFGHYQINAAMPLGKQLGRKPREVAGAIAEWLDVGEMFEKPEIAGPGFINLRLRAEWIAMQLADVLADERLGVPAATETRRYVIDYSSPNVAKPMHVGHLRSTVIGDCLHRVLGFLGHQVIGDNHVGDWGTQFGMILAGYKRFLDAQAFDADPVAELARLYRQVSQLATYQASKPALAELVERLATLNRKGYPPSEQEREKIGRLHQIVQEVESDPDLLALAEENPDLAEVARKETVRLHAGDPENRKLWQSFLPPCMEAIEAVYRRLGVRFDYTHGESFYDAMLPGVVAELERAGLARESEGALCVDVGESVPPCMVRKSDGAYTYATTDLATIKYRIDMFRPDAVLYVVGQPQALHFEQIFAVARLWGYESVELTHVAFGSVLGKDGRPFRTRAGDTVGLESLLDEAVERAGRQYELSRESRRERGDDVPELDGSEQARIAEAVGIGAIKYADLSQARTTDYTFDWDKMLAMEGNTATYMQYAYARVRSIFRKGDVQPELLRSDRPSIRLDEPAEQNLGVLLLRFAEILDAVAAEYRPNILTAWLFDLAGAFSRFYNQCPVLKVDDDGVRRSRLALCDLTARAIRKGLELVGIEVIEQM